MGVSSVSADGNTLTVNLDGIIPVGVWTTFTHTESDTSVRLGNLPADVNGDGTSSSLDVLRLIDAMNGVGDPLPEWGTDINNSGLTGPEDILRVIDLLNGAGCLDAWNGVSLP